MLKNFIIRANISNNVNTVAQIILNGRNSESHPSSHDDGRVVTDEGKANGLGKADVLMQHASWAATEKSIPVALSSRPNKTAKPTMVIR